MQKIVLGMMLIWLLIGMLSSAFTIQPVEASETIYINADGSIDPPTAPIQRIGNIYTLTSNIYGSIVVEKDSIIVDGAGCILHGTGSGTGITLTSKSNITIKNMTIKNFGVGVHLIGSSNNIICGNNITNNGDGIFITDLWLSTYGIGSFNNSVTKNNITLNSGYGVKITRWSERNIVSENIIARNGDGVYVSDFSSHTIIINNNVTLNEGYGIHIDYYSDSNIIIGNYVANNGWKETELLRWPDQVSSGGMRLYRSINNTLRDNQMVNNKYNFELWYTFVSQPINDIDTSNTVNAKPIYHWVGDRDRTVPSDAGYVALINCTNITVKNLNLSSNKDGILIFSTKNSIITGCNITNCIVGIHLDHSSSGKEGAVLGPPSSGIAICKNIIANNFYGIQLCNAYENTIYGNDIIFNNIGIFIEESEKNKIYHNNFINNTGQVKFHGFWMPPFAPARVNTWDDGFPSGGNYWSDYREKYPNATELNGLGIWDIPYIISENNQDNYPLVNPINISVIEIPPIPVVLDTMPPTISIISPENKTYTVKNVSLTFTVSEPFSWIGYSLDGQANVTITGNTTLTELSDGSHSLIVYAQDFAGNNGTSGIIYFTINTQQSEPFPITLIVIVIVVIVIGVAVTLAVIYRKK